MSGGGHGRVAVRAALLAFVAVVAGCDVITLEPDPDFGAIDGGSDGGPVLLDAEWRPDALPDEPPPPPPPDDPPAEPTLDPAFLDFGSADPFTVVRRSVTLRAGRVPLRVERVAVVGVGFDLEPGAPQGPIDLRPGDQVRWTVLFVPPVAGDLLDGALVVHTLQSELRVDLKGRGGWGGLACAPWDAQIDPPPPTLVEPGTRLQLKAGPPVTVGAAEVSLVWTAVETPTGSRHQPLERFDDPQSPRRGGPEDDPQTLAAVYFADKPGRYAFEAQPLLPPEADCEPKPTPVVVHACPCPERPLHVRIAWKRTDDAALGLPRIVPALTDARADGWHEAAQPGGPVDWGRAGAEDDPRIDLHPGPAGRADLWLETGRLDRIHRLGLGVFNVSGGPRTQVDLAVEVAVGDTTLLRLERRGIEAGETFWDALALVDQGDGPVPVVYDRLLPTNGQVWPAYHRPLALDSACHPTAGPACGAGLRCVPADTDWRCR